MFIYRNAGAEGIGVMKAAKTDANQKAIVEALRKAGASVQLLHRVGGGCPDLLVGYRDHNFLFECKTSHGALNKKQLQFFCGWRGQKSIVHNVDDALRAIGLKFP